MKNSAVFGNMSSFNQYSILNASHIPSKLQSLNVSDNISSDDGDVAVDVNNSFNGSQLVFRTSKNSVNVGDMGNGSLVSVNEIPKETLPSLNKN